MPSYRMANLNDLNYGLITHVMASFANPNSSGDMSFGYNISTFVSTVHANGAKACISIGGGGDYSWGSKVSIYENLLATAQTRTDFIHKIMNYLRQYQLDGLDNDMEGNALALPNFNVFAKELGDSVHAEGLEYSAAIGVGGGWGANYWEKSTLEKLDFIMTMSYGGVGSWNWDKKDDGHTYAKMVADMEYFTQTNGIDKHKVLGGIPFYSVEFPNSAQTDYNSFTKTICSIYQDPQFNGQDPFHSDTLYTTENHVVYINSIETIQKKMDYCHDFGGGIMIWEAGQDCFDGSISLLDSMHAYAQLHHLGINQVSKSTTSLYPNPAKSEFVIESGNLGIASYTVYDRMGQAVLQHTGFRNRVSVSSLPKGVYVVTIILENGKKENHQLVVQ